MNWFPRHVFALINIQEEKSIETPMKEVSKVSNERENGGTDVQLGGTYLMQTVITNKIESADANQMASSSGGSLTLGAPGSNTHAESDVIPSSFVAELHNNYLQEHLQGTKTSNRLTTEEVSSEHSVGLFPAINIDKGIEETKKTDHALMVDGGLKIAHKHVAEDEVSIHNLIFRDSARKELYSFFEASTKSLNGQKALTSHASGERISVFSHTSKVSSIQAGKASLQIFVIQQGVQWKCCNLFIPFYLFFLYTALEDSFFLVCLLFPPCPSVWIFDEI